MSLLRISLPIEPLTADAFAPYGDVIEVTGRARNFSINEGFAQRYHDLARIDVAAGAGQPIVSIFRAKPRSLPMRLHMLERHPLGSQAFMPLSPLPFLVVVAQAGPVPQLNQIRCFQTADCQGVNYARGTWHHPLIALKARCDFLVIDRSGDMQDENCDEYALDSASVWIE